MSDLKVGVGINGLGRIGRLVLRRLLARDTRDVFSNFNPYQVKAINSLYPVETIAHLLKYDTIHGKYEAEIRIEQGSLVINGQVITVICENEPQRIPWSSLGVNVVVEATGKFTNRQEASLHCSSGAEK